MNKTKIEWCNYTINPVKGLCPMACDYCYARAMYKRFKWNPEIRWEPEHLIDLSVVPEGSKVFIGSTIELFHNQTKQWMPFILESIKRAPWQTSILLTKQPQNLLEFSPFPKNCWVGVSYNGAGIAKENDKLYGFTGIYSYMKEIEATVKFMSVEPMLRECTPIFNGLHIFNWLIIGAQTPHNIHTAPKPTWVKELTDAAKSLDIPVFHKGNLGFIFDADGFPRRQEFPGLWG